MGSLEAIGTLKKELDINMSDFQASLKSHCDCEKKYDYSIKSYEERINQSLDLQTKASYIVSIVYRLLSHLKPMFKETRTGGKEYLQLKSSYDELVACMDYFKNHVYNFSQKAKTLSGTLRIKQMASPDMLRD